jgi:hypothetical protein
VLAQKSVDLEVIVVDDASQDDTFGWLETQTDPRLRPIRLDKGRLGSGARNVGLAEVRSPYVMFLDDDDLLRDKALARLLRPLERDKGVAGAGGTYVTFDATVKPRRQFTTPVPVKTTIWREQIWGWNLQPGAGVFRTQVARDIGGWDEALSRCEDLDFNLRMYPRKIALTPVPVLRYRVHPGQIEGAMVQLESDLDPQVRTGFVAGLPDGDREIGEQIYSTRPIFFAALKAYQTGEYADAAAGFRSIFRTAPALKRSPIIGPWLFGLLVKATAARTVPSALSGSVRRRRTARRYARLEKIGKA